MQDTIIKGTGNSRSIKAPPNLLTLYPTWEAAAQAMVDGTFPIDLGPLNPAGVQVMGDALNKANLLSDETAALLGLPADAVPDDAFQKAPGIGDIISSARMEFWGSFGNGEIVPCDGQILPASDYPACSERLGLPTAYNWTEESLTGIIPENTQIYRIIQLNSGRLLLSAMHASGIFIYRSDDAGHSWTSAYTTPTISGKPELIQKKDGTILAHTGYKGYISIDNGDTWSELTVINNGTGSQITQLFEGKNGRIFATGMVSRVYMSDDNGKTWSISQNVGESGVLAQDAYGYIYFLCSYKSSSDSSLYYSYIYCSADNGDSWRNILSQSGPKAISGLDSCQNNVLAMGGRQGYLLSNGSIALLYDTQLNPLNDGYVTKNGCNIAITGCNMAFLAGSIMTQFDGNWIQRMPSATKTLLRYVKISDDALIAYEYGRADLRIYRSSADSNILILPHKPGFFIRVK